MRLDTDRKATRANASRTTAAVAFTLCSLGGAGLAPAPAAAQDLPDNWRFAATVYGWLPDIAGHTTFPVGGGSDLNVDASTILDHLEMTFQGSFSVQKAQ